jgi:hypothetical protein
VVTDRPEHSAVPMLVVGVVSAPLLYLLLRLDQVARPGALVSASLLSVSYAHVIFASRVKPYVVDMLVITVLAFVVQRLSRRAWDLRIAAAWVAAAVLLGAFSVHLLLAVAVAGIVLVLHPRGDLVVRAGAVGAQGLAQLGYFLLLQRSFPSEELVGFWEEFDGFVQLDADPADLVAEVVRHTARVGAAVVGDADALSFLVFVVAMAGLAAAAWRGRRTVLARYLLALVGVAFVGSLAGEIPFGPREPNRLVTHRLSIWLLGPLLIGLALAVEPLVDRARRRWSAAGPAALGVAAGLSALVVTLLIRDPEPQVVVGTRTAQEAVARHLRDGDRLIVMSTGMYFYGSEPDVDVDLDFRTFALTGFAVVPVDPPAWMPEAAPAPGEMEAYVGEADRVVLHDAGYYPLLADTRAAFVDGLEALGFTITDTVEIEHVRVDLWERSAR